MAAIFPPSRCLVAPKSTSEWKQSFTLEKPGAWLTESQFAPVYSDRTACTSRPPFPDLPRTPHQFLARERSNFEERLTGKRAHQWKELTDNNAWTPLFM